MSLLSLGLKHLITATESGGITFFSHLFLKDFNSVGVAYATSIVFI